MLTELRVRDFAIIDALSVEFLPGLNAITGETGAGKSILLDAISLLLGDRAEAGQVRAGCERAHIEGVFTLDEQRSPQVDAVLAENGLENEDPRQIVLAREVRSNGRALCRVNGRAVSQSVLRQLGELLIDAHGQSEHLSLLRVREHVNLLDTYAGGWDMRKAVAEKVAALRETRKDIEDITAHARERARRVDMLKFQLEEIRAARLKPNEEEALTEEHLRLANAEALAEHADAAYVALYESTRDSPAALDQIAQAARALTALIRYDKQFEDYSRQLNDATAVIEDVARSIRDYREAIEFNPQRLRTVESRLESLKKLKRKYGESVPVVLAFAEQAEAELSQIENSEERLAALRQQERGQAAELATLALALSRKRAQAAGRLAAEVETELQDLRMGGARFAAGFGYETGEGGLDLPPAELERLAALRPSPGAPLAGPVRFDATGLDRIEFLIAPNLGEGFKPLVKVASGGETARLMLAIQTVLSRSASTPTLIFDEIDQGIGGRVGTVVGTKLWGLSRGHQVLCVTHLPQLAAFGAAHLRVEKITRDNRTATSVRALSRKERVEEIAQMLGTTGKTGVQGAEQLLREADRVMKGE